jgi:hypothetical protein
MSEEEQFACDARQRTNEDALRYCWLKQPANFQRAQEFLAALPTASIDFVVDTLREHQLIEEIFKDNVRVEADNGPRNRMIG